VNDNEISCQAGVPLREASEMACELGLTGLEFACGIPGSVGGACFMNAGAYDGCMADVLSSVSCLMPDGSVRDIAVGDLALGYRKSRIRDEGLVVLSATMSLRPGKRGEIRAKMEDLTERREAKQPLDLPSAGSTFKRPEGHFAGKLITDAGLKGYRFGGAAVSTKHAGFVVNVDNATAADVRAVIAHVQDEVERQFGVRLEPEVRFLG
jgi:UDP-N-acetylmuramate dehydrogenase